MRLFKVLTLTLVLAAAVAPALRAHTLGELGNELRERERYFQPIARPAPGFTLQDAEGRRMSLADLRGQVIVLHFIYASCPDVCPLHAEKIGSDGVSIDRGTLSIRDGASLARTGDFTNNGTLDLGPGDDSSLLGWWRGESDATDSGAGSFDGVLENGATIGPGQFGQGFVFDGVDDRVLVPYVPGMIAGGQITLSAWINPTSIVHGGTVSTGLVSAGALASEDASTSTAIAGSATAQPTEADTAWVANGPL